MSEPSAPDTHAQDQPAAGAMAPGAPKTLGESPSAGQAGSAVVPKAALWPKYVAIFIIASLALSMMASVYLWRKLSNIQEHLARQSADATTVSVEAKVMAKNAQDAAREAAARVALNEVRLGEVALQRSQLDELMQSLSRSRDENLVVDIESALRLAQQQAQLTGSVEPLLAALKTADLRLARAAQPRLNAVRQALIRDTDRIKSATVADIPGLLAKLDELTRLVDDLAVLNEVVTAPAIEKVNAVDARQAHQENSPGESAAAVPTHTSWQATWQAVWQVGWNAVRSELLKLVRVSRIEHPDAVLLSPEQTFFLRENLKLKLLNARLGLLSRQLQSAKADMASASVVLHKYADPTAKSTQVALALLQQVQGQLGNMTIPGLDESFSALALAATGR